MSVNQGRVNITTVTLAAGQNTQVLGTNRNRTYLAIQNTGTNVGTIAFDRAATLNDWIIDGATTVGQRGDALTFEGSIIPTHAVDLFSTAGTTFVIWEGIA